MPADHPDKDREIGSEPDPATFLDTLLALTAEWGRVLAPWGSIAVELGDTYAGSGGAGGDYNEKGLREGQAKFSGSAMSYRKEAQRNRDLSNWPRPKCLALVPQLYAASLAYGRNLLTGEPSPAGQWLVRNMVVWHRPNPAVGALGDKYRPSTSYITIATRSPKRWFDLTAVRTPGASFDRNGETKGRIAATIDIGAGYAWMDGKPLTHNPAGAPPLDCWTDEYDHHDTWTLTTQPSSLAHYAMWPPKLAERLILSMCPAEVCTFCGEPRRRVEKASYVGAKSGRDYVPHVWQSGGGDTHAHSSKAPDEGARMVPVTLGWTDCGCGVPFAPGVVLDPFAGTFTTGLVAEYHGRDAIGIDIDSRNRDMVPARREEVRRSLNPTHVKPIEGQLDMFGEVVA